jgi:hypothetical protein
MKFPGRGALASPFGRLKSPLPYPAVVRGKKVFKKMLVEVEKLIKAPI